MFFFSFVVAAVGRQSSDIAVSLVLELVLVLVLVLMPRSQRTAARVLQIVACALYAIHNTLYGDGGQTNLNETKRK